MPAFDPQHSRTVYLPLPLPGTGFPPRALFVGRLGTLIRRPAQGWCSRFDPALFSAGSLELLFRARQAGWSLYLIGNEEAVARGRMSDASYERFERELLAYLTARGITIARNYACLEHPEGKGLHRRDSVFLFPNTGALYHAAQVDGIELSESWVIGDNELELAAGWRAGCRIASVANESDGEASLLEVEPALRAKDLKQVLSEVLAIDQCMRR